MKPLFLKIALVLFLFFQFKGTSSCPVTDRSDKQKKASPQQSRKGWRPLARTVITFEHFRELSRHHQTIAILPVEVYIAREEAGPNSQLGYRALVEAKNWYRVLFAFLQLENSSHHNRIQVQDIAHTQRLLESQHLEAAALRQMPPAQLAALLGVDAVLFCSIDREEKLVAEANLLHNLKRISGLAGPSAGKASAQLYDGKTNEKIWQFEGLLTGNLGLTMDQTIKSVSSIVAHELPYF